MDTTSLTATTRTPTVEDAPSSPRAMTPTSSNILQLLAAEAAKLGGTLLYGDTDSLVLRFPSTEDSTSSQRNGIPEEEDDGEVSEEHGGDTPEDGSESDGSESDGADDSSDDDAEGAESDYSTPSDDDTVSESSCCGTVSDIADIQPYGLHPFAAEMPETTTITQRVQQYYEPPCESADHRYRTFLRAVDLHMLMADIEHDIKGRVRDAQRRKARPVVRIRLCHPAQLLRTIHYYSGGVRVALDELGPLLARYNSERRGRATPRLRHTNQPKSAILAEFGAPLLAEQGEW